MPYSPQDHYWIVGDHPEQDEVYSSAAAAYVSTSAQAYIDWLAEDEENVPTSIATQDELLDVLLGQYEEGLPLMIRLQHIRAYDLINYLNGQGLLGSFITEIGGFQSVNMLRLLTIDRIDITQDPVRQALIDAGVTLNNIPPAMKRKRRANG